MSEGPSRQQIERVREALDRHDSELREEEAADAEETDEAPEDEDEDG
jgi:hypothetical protein